MKLKTLSAILLGASLVFAAGCQREVISGSELAPGQEVEIAVTAAVPGESLAVRSAENPGDGTLAKRAVLQVYELVNGTKEPYKEQVITTVGDDLKANFTIRVITGRTYDFVFWADTPAADDANASAYYETSDLRAITYKKNADTPVYANNNDGYDAFFGIIPDQKINSKSTLETTLRRPFGQVNLFATDLADVRETDVPKFVKVTFDKVFTGFNALTGEVTGTADGSLSPAEVALPVNFATAAEGKNQISFDYIFAPASSAENVQQVLVDLKAEFFREDKTTQVCDPVTATGLIPVQRNHRTNVSGNFLTTGVDISVEIKPVFEENDIEKPIQ